VVLVGFLASVAWVYTEGNAHRLVGALAPPGSTAAASTAVQPDAVGSSLATTSVPTTAAVGGPAEPPTSAASSSTSVVPPVALSAPPGWVPIDDGRGGPAVLFRRDLSIAGTGYVPAPGLSAVLFDSAQLRFALHPGTQQPGGVWLTPPEVTTREAAGLVAGFNSGFKMTDAHGGFATDGRGQATIRTGAASFVIDGAGRLDVGLWGRDFTDVGAYVSVRQNLALLVDGGRVSPTATNTSLRPWGGSTSPTPDVARSALGVSATGDVIFVAGERVTPRQLADALVQVGAARAMELDINANWVTCNLFHPDPATGAPLGVKLRDDMRRAAERYLTTDERDFVTVNV
jgi:hypothetical protein